MLRVEQKIVLVTRPTRMQGLIARHATASQARFKLVRARQAAAPRAPAGATPAQQARQDDDLAVEALAEIDQLQDEDTAYSAVVSRLRAELADLAPVYVLDRQYLPTYVFGPADVVVTVGQDGLVANAAKYALGLPLVAVNPDPTRIDGILLPFATPDAPAAVRRALRGEAPVRRVTLAQATLVDGQRLLAFNDLFIGARTHVSARYRLDFAGQREDQSSSGVIVSTGAGSTGWLSSLLNMAPALGALAAPPKAAPQPPRLRLAWDDPRLVFVTREPFLSKTSSIRLTAGLLAPGQALTLESAMSREGVIFSDGVETDFLDFNAGAIAHIRAANEQATLVAKS